MKKQSNIGKGDDDPDRAKGPKLFRIAGKLRFHSDFVTYDWALIDDESVAGILRDLLHKHGHGIARDYRVHGSGERLWLSLEQVTASLLARLIPSGTSSHTVDLTCALEFVTYALIRLDPPSILIDDEPFFSLQRATSKPAAQPVETDNVAPVDRALQPHPSVALWLNALLRLGQGGGLAMP